MENEEVVREKKPLLTVLVILGVVLVALLFILVYKTGKLSSTANQAEALEETVAATEEEPALNVVDTYTLPEGIEEYIVTESADEFMRQACASYAEYKLAYSYTYRDGQVWLFDYSDTEYLPVYFIMNMSEFEERLYPTVDKEYFEDNKVDYIIYLFDNIPW